MGEAIETTFRLYPGLLEHNQNLLFQLKCRQFVEMINGTDSEVRYSSVTKECAKYVDFILIAVYLSGVSKSIITWGFFTVAFVKYSPSTC